MSKLSKQKRKEAAVDSRLNSVESTIHRLDGDVKRLKKQYDEHIVAHIIDDLDKETFPGSGRPLYTYSDIGDKYGTSPATVGRIAEEHGRNRRGKKLG